MSLVYHQRRFSLEDSKQRQMTRRAFLRSAGLGVAGLVAAACGAETPAGTTGGAATAVPAAGGAAATAAPAAGGAPAIKSEGESIRIALFGSRDAADRRAKLIPGFVQKFPGVKVEYIPIQGTDWEQFFSKVLAMKAAGDTPDITFVATEGTQLFAGKGLAVPLDDFIKRDQKEMEQYFKDVHPALIEAMMYEGSLYELPIDFNAANMYLNTTVLKENGIEVPSSDWTKDQFYDIAKKVTKKSGGQTEVFGYGWVIRLWGGWMPWIFVNGGNLLTEERAPGGEWLWQTFYKDDPAAKERGGGWRWNAPKANDPANVEALEFMNQLLKEGLTPTPSLGGGSELQGFFTSNKLAMTPAGGFYAGGLKSAGVKPDGFDALLFPKWKSQRHQFGTAGYVIMQDAKNKDLAWEYVKYLSSVEAMTAELDGNNSTPTRRSMMTAERYAPTGPAHWQTFYDTLDKHPDTAPIPAPPESNPMTTIFTKHTGVAMTGGATPKDALDAMQKDLEELFAKRK
jgi:ABC-type glycerol-3-phosphate transport system substrate-binding protein